MPDLGGGYAMNPQVAQGKADLASQQADPRTDSDKAGYMELEGAQKDADCSIVAVQGGISSALGCCNLFDPAPKAPAFSCGTCTKITGQQNASPLEGNETRRGDSGAQPGAAQPGQPVAT